MSISDTNPASPGLTLIDRALDAFKLLVLADPSHSAALGKARQEFFGAAGNQVNSLDAERRLFEWFLFERSYDEIGGVGARAIAEAWLEEVGEELAPLLPGLLDSRVGVYEVSSVEPGSGVWVKDLSGVGEYPLAEPEAATEFEVADLIVGRLYPFGEGVFLASSAATCVRNPKLTEALRQDLGRAREARRGVPRLSQQTLEALFFQSSLIPDRVSPPSVKSAIPDPASLPSVEQVIAEGRDWLLAQGLTPGDVEDMLEALAEEAFDPADLAPGGSDILGGILAELAIQTEINLAEARARLLTIWTRLHAPEPSDDAPLEAQPRKAQEQQYSSDKTRRALEAFDATRASGGRVEDAFEQLEQDLGLEPGSSDDSGDKTPDFPGVVGAMVEEFLWERAAKQEPELNSRALHQFASFAAHIGAFEDVSHSDMLLFSGCWLIERGDLTNATDAEQTLEALEKFCRWAEAEHSVELWSLFSESFEDLAASLPRLITANRSITGGEPNSRVLLYQVQADLRAKRVEAGGTSYDIDPKLLVHLREGDLVRAVREGDGLTIVGCYPGLVRGILQPKS